MSTRTRKAFSPPKKRNATYFNIQATPVVLPSRAALSRMHAAVRGSPKPLGTSTNIYNPANPPASVAADDVAIKQKVPNTNPTIGAGVVTAATAAQVIADTGPLPAGTYLVVVSTMCSGVGAAGKHVQTEHRNAANAATLAVKGGTTYGSQSEKIFERVVVALNERIRVVQSAVVGAAAEVAIAHIEAYLLGV
jgi:hypothetical protein